MFGKVEAAKLETSEALQALERERQKLAVLETEVLTHPSPFFSPVWQLY